MPPPPPHPSLPSGAIGGVGAGGGGGGRNHGFAEDLNLFADLLVAPYGDAVVFGISEDFVQYERGFWRETSRES